MHDARGTRTVNVHEAKSQLSRLLLAVEHGEDVVIARAGRPVARLVPASAPGLGRAPGAWRGRMRVADDFDDTPDEIIAGFGAGDLEP